MGNLFEFLFWVFSVCVLNKIVVLIKVS